MIILDRGIFRFANGKEIYIEEVQYSYNGKDKWEEVFQPFEHIDPDDPTQTVPGHKYRRVRHAGDDKFQYPAYIVAEDGDTPVLRKNDTHIQWRLSLESEEDWQDLVALEDITGPEGEKGNRGEGWHVDLTGYLDSRPDCGSTCTTTNTCDTCNPNPPCNCGSTDAAIFMSLGNHRLEQADVGDNTNRWHTTDGITWIQSTESLIGTPVLAWGAQDAANATETAYTCNLQGHVVAFHMLPEPYDSRGLCYVCADGLWTPLFNAIVPTGEVKIDNLDTLDYLENKLDGVTIGTDGTVVFVIDDSIDYDKLDLASFGDGLEDDVVNELIIVDVNDFVGFGLRSYERTNGYDDIQVLVDDFIGDGLTTEAAIPVDGETANIIIVNLDDLLSINSGLMTRLPVAGESTDLDHKDLFVKPYHGVLVTSNGVTLNVDGNIFQLDENGLTLKEDAIGAVHLGSDIPGDGLVQGASGDLNVNIDGQVFTFNGNNELTVLDDGITGAMLNDDVANENEGLKVINDKLVMLVNEDYFTFNTSGELTLSSGAISGILTDNAIKYIKVGSEFLRNGVTMQGSANDNYVDIVVTEGASNIITIEAKTNESALEGLIQSIIGDISNIGIDDIDGLSDILNEKMNVVDGLKLNTIYGNMRVVDSGGNAGIQLTPDNGLTWYKLGVTVSNNTGHIITTKV